MRDKTVLVTGANGGLGTAFVEKILEQKPSKIYATARDVKTLAQLQELSSTIEVLALDITSKESIKNAAAKVDKIDLLINNAGINSNTKLFDDSFIDFEVNLKGTANVTQAFFEKLKKSQGVVVNVTSIVALINLPAMANYSASKAALHSFTEALRAEFELFGGRVYEVLPGPIETKMTEGVDMIKTSPQDIVDATFASMQKEEFEIYPDAFARVVKQRLETEADKVTAEFAMSLQA